MDNGVLYIASGRSYVNEAITSARSVKDYNDIPITLISDRDVSEPCFDEVIKESNFSYHYGDSVLKIPPLPYGNTLLLDTDTVVCDDITDIFDILSHFDIAVSKIADSEFSLKDGAVPESFPEYNTGVIAFKKGDKTENFIQDWKKRYNEYLDNGVRMNQPAFREILYKSSLRIATLPTEYNCRVDFGGHLNNGVKILHGNITNSDNVIEKLNKYNVPRVYYNEDEELKLKNIDTSNVLKI